MAVGTWRRKRRRERFWTWSLFLLFLLCCVVLLLVFVDQQKPHTTDTSVCLFEWFFAINKHKQKNNTKQNEEAESRHGSIAAWQNIESGRFIKQEKQVFLHCCLGSKGVRCKASNSSVCIQSHLHSMIGRWRPRRKRSCDGKRLVLFVLLVLLTACVTTYTHSAAISPTFGKLFDSQRQYVEEIEYSIQLHVHLFVFVISN